MGFFPGFSCSLHRLPIMYHACLFCDLSWPLHRLPITYNVCLDDDLSCLFLSYFQWFTMPTQIVIYPVFFPSYFQNLWCLRRVWFIPYFTKKSYCLACLTRLCFVWIVPWFFFSLLMFIFDNEWYFAGLVLPWVLCNLHLCTFILYVRRVPLHEYLFELGYSVFVSFINNFIVEDIQN
jgi:hypothetical protein